MCIWRIRALAAAWGVFAVSYGACPCGARTLWPRPAGSRAHWPKVAVLRLSCPVGCGISSPTRNRTCIPWIARQILNSWTTREALILSSLKLRLLATPPPVSHARYIHGLPEHFTHRYRTHSSVHSLLMLAPAHASPSTSDGLFLANGVGTQAVPSPIYLPAFLDHSQDQLPQVRFPGSKH